MDKRFGYRLRDLRTEKGLTGTQLANLVGTSKGVVAQWESGRCYPNNDRIVFLAEYFQVTTDYLLGRTDSRKSIEVLTGDGIKLIDIDEFTQEQQELIKNLIKQFNVANGKK